jgi:hypothetical protein
MGSSTRSIARKTTRLEEAISFMHREREREIEREREGCACESYMKGI